MPQEPDPPKSARGQAARGHWTEALENAGYPWVHSGRGPVAYDMCGVDGRWLCRSVLVMDQGSGQETSVQGGRHR